jgi:hypothetical protein
MSSLDDRNARELLIQLEVATSAVASPHDYNWAKLKANRHFVRNPISMILLNNRKGICNLQRGNVGG